MSLRDGNLTRDDLYTTSDLAFAAYLLLCGYELLGAIDDGRRNDWGKKRLDYGITHTDPYVLRNLESDIEAKYQEYEGMFLPVPHDPERKLNFRLYYRKLNELHRALDNPIRKDEHDTRS